jgi:hypothetical protein
VNDFLEIFEETLRNREMMDEILVFGRSSWRSCKIFQDAHDFARQARLFCLEISEDLEQNLLIEIEVSPIKSACSCKAFPVIAPAGGIRRIKISIDGIDPAWVYTKAGTYIHSWAQHIQLRGGTLSECAVREQRGGTFYFGNVPGLAPTILRKDKCPFFARSRLFFSSHYHHSWPNKPTNTLKARQNPHQWHQQLEAYRRRTPFH